MPVKLGYWKIRGLGQPIRLLLAYTETEFEDKQFEAGPARGVTAEDWFVTKHTLGLDFPNLPYLMDGDIKIVQSNAILRYIGRKNGLDGKTEKQKIAVDIVVNQAMDFRNGFVRFTYNRGFDSLEADVKESLLAGYNDVAVKALQAFEEYLADKPFFTGDTITFVDFAMYEILDHHRVFNCKLFEPCPKLKAFMDRFEAIPQIAKFMKSDRFMKSPINAPFAMLGKKTD